MLDVTPLTAEVDRFADGLRALPQSALLRGAAAQAHELAAELARRAQLLEFPDGDPRPLPDVGPFACGDQLAVAGHDLAEALAAMGTQEQLQEAVRLVAEVRAKR